jgi:hypothetical protein
LYGRETILPFYLLHQPVIISIAFFVVQWLQRRGALLIGIEAWRVDDDFSAQVIAVAGLELQIGIHA